MPTPEFWRGIQFALECLETPEGYYDYSTKETELLAAQSKYSWSDLHLILVPVLDSYRDLIVHTIVDDGRKALAVLRAGGTPVLERWRTRFNTDAEILENATDRAFSEDYWESEDDWGVESDPEGYTAFFRAQLAMPFYSKYEGQSRYFWDTVLAILKGEKPPTYDVLIEFLGPFMQDHVLREFLERHLRKQGVEFERWESYVSDVCPVE